MEDGSAVVVKVLDGLVIYRVVTADDIFPTIGRDLKDYFSKIGVLSG